MEGQGEWRVKVNGKARVNWGKQNTPRLTHSPHETVGLLRQAKRQTPAHGPHPTEPSARAHRPASHHIASHARPHTAHTAHTTHRRAHHRHGAHFST